jgi:SAM-dependent methyltransferase
MTRTGDIQRLLARYPKNRPTLSPAAAAVHDAILKGNRERVSALSKVSDLLESWMHWQIAKGHRAASGQRILEIGAGTLNHLDYESAYAIYDVIEPFAALYENRKELDRVRNIYPDITSIAAEERYDRILSIATLEHLTHLPEAVARAALLLNHGGLFQASIPSEGGFLWGLSWRATFAISYKITTGRDWSEHMRYEHVNDAREIMAVLAYFFERVSVRRFPLPLHHLSLYAAIDARAPRLDRCLRYLETRA